MRFMERMERSLTDIRSTKEKNDFLIEEINKVIEENGWSLISTKKISESIIDIGETPKQEFQYNSYLGNLKLKALYLPTGVGLVYDSQEGEKETRFLLRKYIYDVDKKSILINRNALIANVKQMLEKCKASKTRWEKNGEYSQDWPAPRPRQIIVKKEEKIVEQEVAEEVVVETEKVCPNCGEGLENYWKSCPICRMIFD